MRPIMGVSNRPNLDDLVVLCPASYDFELQVKKVTDRRIFQIGRAYAINVMRPFEVAGFPKIDQGHAEIAERIVDETNAPNERL